VKTPWLSRRVLGMSPIEWLVVAAIASVLAGVLSCPVSRMPRGYYQGKDQFQWGKQLHTADPSHREEAITALCQILLNAKGKYRSYIVITVLNSLGEAGPQAKVAVPTLQVLLEQEEDRELQNWLRRTLHLIDPDQHPVQGSMGSSGWIA
jgi:hypothetical protein